MSRKVALSAIGLALACFLLAVAGAAPAPPVSLQRADELFEQKHYKEAADAYLALVEAEHEKWHHAAERIMMCKLRLSLYDDAIEAAEDYVERTAGTPQEARAERLTAHLYMLLPHWGTRAGGEFYRSEHREGIYLQSWQYDKKHAVRHMERARELYAKHDTVEGRRTEEGAAWHEERIECIFDLVNLLSRFSIYDDQPHFWYRWWGERDEFLAETAGEEDFDEGYSYWQFHRKRPVGLRIGPDGEPIFPKEPAKYSAELPGDEKMLYLLAEVRGLDQTRERRHTALSYYRQAMLARKRFGMDRLNTYAGFYYDGSRQPLKEELESFNPWELADKEALVLAGGRIRKVELPEQFDVLGLLRKVASEQTESGIADQAWYAASLYYQSRQQYLRALDEYEALRESHPGTTWAHNAAGQIARIKAPQVRLSQTGVQLPDRPALLQASYRNMERIWFVARKVNLKALLEELRAETLREREEAYRYFNLLQNWHHYLTYERRNRWEARLVAKHLGPEVARWSDPVRN
ncbi:MAG: hypothetical protein ACYS8K_04850, partial [Planctomycetota bacterium]